MSMLQDRKGFRSMQQYIERECGIHIDDDKAYLIEGRLGKLLAESGARDFEEFYHFLYKSRDRSMTEKVIDAITTNETMWFRDKTPWRILEEIFMPRFIQELRTGKRLRIRLWSAAASTGQEAYSTAMCIDRYLKDKAIAGITLDQFEIVATDISPAVLQVARAGKYDSISILRGLDAGHKERYFQKEGRVWSIDDRIRRAVRFERFNLQDAYQGLGCFDVIFCRYVAIYFSEPLKRDIFRRMADQLRTGGALFLGGSEIFTGYGEHYQRHEHQGGIYYLVKREP
ncbi:protein-glutamate O-methyltransferase CheR [Heliobacterium gestii]|uniref:protein-glutamate O-methyltransferase n=1 Tax=Heliomicrobium gestii TaxID=2699 RepID=A0A845L7L9_HELGE|nr:protein-glutamate O-methyltransferase CheR [Heliomicrobium gestii]MBM7866071.1 chemotaxis protein methyltransferase CheR [Heliomicrobium gestii]MZP42602.1 protein-glutamate O-methyltransferase CheR [Heliomicrobium gestii]